MAEATPIVEEEIKIFTTGVTLTLTREEAYALAVLFAMVGGDPKTTARGIIDSVADALKGAGFDWHLVTDRAHSLFEAGASLYFNAESLRRIQEASSVLSADKVERDWLAPALDALAEWRCDALEARSEEGRSDG